MNFDVCPRCFALDVGLSLQLGATDAQRLLGDYSTCPFAQNTHIHDFHSLIFYCFVCHSCIQIVEPCASSCMPTMTFRNYEEWKPCGHAVSSMHFFLQKNNHLKCEKCIMNALQWHIHMKHETITLITHTPI